MDFDKLKEDMIQKYDKELTITGFTEIEVQLAKFHKKILLNVTELVCEILEEYETRKQNN
jgi:hypothetical protein